MEAQHNRNSNEEPWQQAAGYHHINEQPFCHCARSKATKQSKNRLPRYARNDKKRVGLLYGVYTEYFGFLSTGSVNGFAYSGTPVTSYREFAS